MAYRNEKQGRQNCFCGQYDMWTSMNTPHGLSQMWNPYPMSNNIQTFYQNRSPQNPSIGMGMPQGYMVDSYMRQMDMVKQEEMEKEEQKDMEYWRQMYPEKVKKIQQYVMELCDREDYDDSFIYDEYPDPISIRNMAQQIWERLQEDKMFQTDTEQEAQLVNAMPDRVGGNWLKDIISVLLFDELHRRRNHSKRYRRKWY